MGSQRMRGDIDLQKSAKIGLWVSGTLLALSGVVKLISALGSARILLEADPLFGISQRELYLLVGILEIWVVINLARRRNLRWKLLLVAALSTNLLIYRIGLWWLHVRKPCPCLGNAAAWTGADPKFLDIIMKASLAWLLVTSYGFLLLPWQRAKPSPTMAALPATGN
jgi:hypothetical protein